MHLSVEIPRVVLFSATRDWHARALLSALRRRGAEARMLRLEDCSYDTTAPAGLRLGARHELPDAALVRTVSAGSFEAVTRRLGILHALTEIDITVRNGAQAIERCVDKSMTAFLLARAGLPTPDCWTVESPETAAEICRQAQALVLKPLFGSQGRGLMLIRSAADLPPPEAVAGVYHLQRFVGREGSAHRDYRVLVVDGEPVATMARDAVSWITNVKQGGRPTSVPPDRELDRLATAAARAVGAWFCGVDILRAPDGTPYILEVNSMPAWSGLQKVTPLDIAGHLAARFLQLLQRPRERKVA